MEKKIDIKKILCPFDYSECSARALMYAAYLARSNSAKLYLMHVIDIRGFEHIAPLEVPAPESEAVASIKRGLIEKIPQELKGKAEVETVVTVGIPVVEIIDAAREKGVDMIVMGTHGRTGIAHVIMGSVAENVVRRAPCPVLTVRYPT